MVAPVVKLTELTRTLRCKVAVCGDPTVGKSALVNMFISKGQKFPKEYLMTSGINVVVGSVQVPETKTLVEMFLYDTAGSSLTFLAGTDSSKDSLAALWNGVYYAVLVYDVSSQDSFESCKLWLDELKKARLDKERPLKAVLVAAKSDLPNQRHQVAADVAEVWATANGLDFFAVSSVPPGSNVDAPFLAIAKACLKSYDERVTAFQDACRNY
ncbi:small rab-related GTPase [Haematococcus lacustris]